MDALEADRRFLSATLHETVARIETRLERGPRRRMEAGYGLCEHGREVLAVIQDLDAQANDEIDDATSTLSGERDELNRYLQGSAQEAGFAKLRKTIFLARHLLVSLSALDEPPDALGLGAAYAVRDMGRTLIGEDVDLVEIPVDGPSYATVSWPFDATLRKGDVSLRGKRRSRPVLVLFPRAEANNVLLLPLLIHELGHPCWSERGLGSHLWAQLTQSSWNQVFELAEEGKAGIPLPRGALEQELRGRFEEHFCDALACALLGPSYLLAFAGWVASISLTESAAEHPPTIVRIHMMLEQLRQDEWGEVLARFPLVLEWLDGLVAAEPEVALDSTIVDALKEAGPTIVALAREVAGELSFTPASYAEQGSLLEELLALNVLPAQLDHEGTHADRRAILLSGWLACMADRPPEKFVDALKDLSFQAFLDKALEMSFVLERWSEK